MIKLFISSLRRCEKVNEACEELSLLKYLLLRE
jgi:hypothetical protein